MNISTNHYKLRKVKKRWVTFVVTTMAGLTLMTAGASSASADSSTLDSQVNQTSTLVQPTSDGTSVVAPSQEKVPSNPTEVKDTDNQSENQSQPTQAASLTTQEDDKEPTSQNNQAPADSPKQVKEPTSVAPASDGAVVQQDPQTQKQEEKTIVEGIVEEVIDKILKQYTVNLNVRTGNHVKINIPNVSIVRDIKGNVKGASEITYTNKEIGIDGEYMITRGSFSVNGNDFKIDGAEIRFTPSTNGTASSISNPFVIFDASTIVNGDRIDINVSGNINSPEIKFSSSSGKTREEIISQLAFNTVVGNTPKKPGEKNGENSADGLVVAGSLVNTALNELIFSSVTGKIRDILKVSKFSVSTSTKASLFAFDLISACSAFFLIRLEAYS